MSEISKGFHARDGWYFRREDDGSVHIAAPDSMGPGASQVVTLDANTWASVVASVSRDGDNVHTFIAAHHLHEGSEPVAVGERVPPAHKTGPTSVWLGDEPPVQGTISALPPKE